MNKLNNIPSKLFPLALTHSFAKRFQLIEIMEVIIFYCHSMKLGSYPYSFPIVFRLLLLKDNMLTTIFNKIFYTSFPQMKLIQTWTIRLSCMALLSFGLLVLILLKPGILHAKKTTFKNYMIHHNQALDHDLLDRLEEVTLLLSKSELYDPAFTIDLCLNDGSAYSSIIEMTHGQNFGVGFANKVSLQGTADYTENTVELNGYKWNLTQLMVHETIHCLQFHKLGLLKSNPLGNIPRWKNEGYPEYISRQNSDQLDLAENIERLQRFELENKNGWDVTFEDNTSVSRQYYRYWLLTQYCMEIKNMSYAQILQDSTDEQSIQKEMMDWYESNPIIEKEAPLRELK